MDIFKSWHKPYHSSNGTGAGVWTETGDDLTWEYDKDGDIKKVTWRGEKMRWGEFIRKSGISPGAFYDEVKPAGSQETGVAQGQSGGQQTYTQEAPSAMEPTSSLDTASGEQGSVLDVASDERPIADTEDFWKNYTTADRVLYTEDGIEPMQGEDVNALKNGLLKLGYNVDTSNPIYDEETAKTVYQFQTDYGLTKDGEAGKQTFGKMKELLDKSSQGSQ